jgi:hypothetical protein
VKLSLFSGVAHRGASNTTMFTGVDCETLEKLRGGFCGVCNTTMFTGVDCETTMCECVEANLSR